MATPPRLPRRRVLHVALGVGLLALLLGALASVIAQGQLDARRELRERFALRAQLVADFVHAMAALHAEDEGFLREVSAHLNSTVPIPEQRAYLIDDAGVVRASSLVAPVGRHIGEQRPGLPLAPGHPATMRVDGRDWVAAARPVVDHRYMVVLAVPADRLYEPLRGTAWPSWLLFGIVAVIGAATLLLLARLLQRGVELDYASRVDALTGVHNRRHLRERLPAVASAASRAGRDWAVLLIDVDHFKQVNDSRGHGAGDDVLRAVAHAVVEQSRLEDLAGRWGGDEFIVILPDTGCEGACAVAERIRESVRSHELTLSIGCAAGHPADPEELLHQADVALYEAKRAGRDRVVAVA